MNNKSAQFESMAIDKSDRLAASSATQQETTPPTEDLQQEFETFKLFMKYRELRNNGTVTEDGDISSSHGTSAIASVKDKKLTTRKKEQLISEGDKENRMPPKDDKFEESLQNGNKSGKSFAKIEKVFSTEVQN